MKLFRHIYLHNLFFVGLAVLFVLFVVSFFIPLLFPIAIFSFIFFFIVVGVDVLFLFATISLENAEECHGPG